MHNIKNALFSFLSPKYYNLLCYYYLHLKLGFLPRRLNLVSPKTFNEKIIWLKTFHNDESYQHLVDKSAARDYVRDILGEGFLVPMHYQFDDVQEIKKVCLPNKFILKMIMVLA